MQTMSTAAENDSKEPYSSDSDESEEQQSPPDDVDHEEDEEDGEDDIGGLTEAERQEMERLNSQLDFLNVALDEFEQKNSDLQQRLIDFLAQNSATATDDKAAAASSDDAKDDKAASSGSADKS